LAGNTRIKPKWAQITKEQRHEQEIYFGADADYRHGICADRRLCFHTRSADATPAATDPAIHQSIHLAFHFVAFNGRSNEFKHDQHQ
jgi:hypothetical protein